MARPSSPKRIFPGPIAPCVAELSPDDVAITCGCTEALTLALKTVAKPGDTIAIESPTYFGLLHALEALGLRALELPTDATEGIDLVALEKAVKGKKVAACLFAAFHLIAWKANQR